MANFVRSEMMRLASFTATSDDSAGKPSTLARQGFYFNRETRNVECCVCKCSLNSTEELDNPEAKHRRMSPKCQFVASSGDGVDELQQLSLSRSAQEYLNHGSINSSAPDMYARGGLYSQDSNSVIQSVYTSAMARAARSTTVASSVYRIDRNNPDYTLLKQEQERLQTFYDWPPSSVVRPAEIAKAGMFYTGTDDRVQCAYCYGYLSRWVPGDTPAGEHRKHFPTCEFVRMSLGGAVPPDDMYRSRQRNFEQPAQIVGNHVSASERFTSDRLQNVHRPDSRQMTIATNSTTAHNDRPKHPEFEDIRRRVQSFRTGNVAPGQSAEALAEAGFYFVGPLDNVRCYYCDGGLKNWKIDDVPWTEHARWFQNCGFVKRRSNQQSLVSQEPVVSNSGVNNTRPTNNAATGVTLQSNQRLDVEALMETTTVRAVLDMGINVDEVRRAIQERLAVSGDNFPDANSLCDAVFALQAAAVPSEMSEAMAPPVDNNTSGPADNTTLAPKQNEAPTNTADTDNKKSHTASHADTSALIDENRQLREARQCKVCMDDDMDTAFLPCGHLSCCHHCAPALRQCPICRAAIRGTVKTYLR